MEKISKLIFDFSGQRIVSSFRCESCEKCLLEHSKSYSSYNCPFDGRKARLGNRQNSSGEIIICSVDSKTTKNFHSLLDAFDMSLSEIVSTFSDLKGYADKCSKNQVDLLAHNIKTLSGQAIQRLYTVVPQETLILNYKEVVKTVSDIIASKTELTAKALIQISKINMGIKSEFSAYERLSSKGKIPNTSYVNPRNVIMIVIYMFLPDFSDKNVYVDVSEFYSSYKLCFEDLQVASYYIIENAVKYIMPGSRLKVDFLVKGNLLYVNLDMISLYIRDGEENEIFKLNYSGEMAKKSNKAGKGIGMYRAKQIIQCNNGDISVEPGEVEREKDGLSYAHNVFIITLPIS